MKTTFVITPVLDKREELLPLFKEALFKNREVTVHGSGTNGITVTVPKDFDLHGVLPLEHRDQYFIEAAEAPSFYPLTPKIRTSPKND